MPPKKSELPGSPKIQELDEDKADEPSLLPMTPESKQLAAVIATAVATAMAGKSASPDSSSSMVRYSAGVSLASRTRSIISIVRNLKLHLVTLPGANLASNELLLTTQTREVHSHIHWALDTHRCFLCARLGPYAHLPPLMRTSKSTLDLEVSHAVACVRIA